MKLFAFYDKVGEKWLPPFLSENEETAKRVAYTAFSKEQFVSDYSVYLLAEWNDSDKVIPLGTIYSEEFCFEVDDLFIEKKEKKEMKDNA